MADWFLRVVGGGWWVRARGEGKGEEGV